MPTNDAGAQWVLVHDDGPTGPTLDSPKVRRYSVPGGWLYQVQMNIEWSQPVFVPALPLGTPS